jgi:gliding motility-associated-like protein
VTPLPAPALPATVPLCGGQSFTLNPGSGFASYLWSTGANSQSISVTTPGTYTVTVSNASGCTATALCTITNYAPVVAAVSGNTNGCLGIPQTLVATGGFSSYLWSNGATTQAITVNGTGQYTVTVTSVNGCTATASLNVTFGPLPVVNMAPFDTICQGQVATLNAGPGFSSYLWSTGATTQTITAGGAGVYSVTVTNANGCSNSGLMTLVKSDVFVIDLGPATMSMCDRGILLLNASPRYVDYLWSDGSVNQTLVVTQPGLYSVTVTDMYGCQSSDAVTVTSNGVTQMDFLPADLTMCAGESFIIDAGSQWLYYSWANGSADQYHATTQPGVFYVTVTDPSGCRFSDSVKVVVDSPPTLELGANQNLCPGESITLDAGTGFNSYVWSTGQTTQTIAVTDPRSYSVTVTFNTCTLTDITNVGEDCPGRIFIPNVFSPNGDGLNDFFKIDYVNLDRLTVTVFDRWGKFLYTSNDKNFGWDGKYNNNPLPEGTYYYVVRYVLTDNANELEAKGTVMIIR